MCEKEFHGFLFFQIYGRVFRVSFVERIRVLYSLFLSGIQGFPILYIFQTRCGFVRSSFGEICGGIYSRGLLVEGILGRD